LVFIRRILNFAPENLGVLVAVEAVVCRDRLNPQFNELLQDLVLLLGEEFERGWVVRIRILGWQLLVVF